MSSSSSSTSASLLTSSRLRLSGTDLASGMDTDSIIKKLVSGTQSKIDSQSQKKQIAEWKQEAYRDIISQLQTFSNTYFSYSNSSTNLLSSTFFDITSLTSSSKLVSATGNTGNAQNMVINSISQLASKASYVSSQQVSNETITSGKIQESWTKSNVGGKSLVLNYGGTDYTIRLSGDLQLSDKSSDKDSNIQLIVDELNKQVNANDSLKGNLTFTKTDAGSIRLNTTDSSKSVTISAYASSSTDTSGQKFLNALGFTSGSSGSSLTSNQVDTSLDGYLFNKTIDADSELKLKIGDQSYTLTLGADYDISDSGNFDTIAENVSKLLQKQVDANDELKGKLTVSADGDKVTFESTGSDAITITGGSQNLMDGLGLTKNGTASTKIQGSGINEPKLIASYLSDAVSGNSMTFNWDGLKKTITFDENDLQTNENFTSATGISNYLKRKLETAFGAGKVTVKVTVSDGTDGTLTFTAGNNSVLTVTSTDATDLLSSSGALRIDSGETNRVETSKTLKQLSSELSQTLTKPDKNGNYILTVNEHQFTFSKNDTLGNVISTINNNEDANVTVSYSQTTDTFRITYDETGSHGKTEMKDESGNLAKVLFGIDSSDSTKNNGTATAGKDLKMNVSVNGSKVDVVRSSNTTTIDGVDLTVTGTTTDDDGNIMDNANITFSATNNTDDLYKKISDFVNDYNKIIDAINQKVTESAKTTSKNQQKYLPLTDSQKEDMSESEITTWETEAKKGILQNDSKLSKILSDLRTAMTGIVQSTDSSLSQVGISTVALDYTSGGQLTIDSDALKKAIAENPDKIASMFTGTDGIAQRVKKVLDNNVGTFGGDGALLLVAGSETRSVDESELGKQITQYENIISDLKDDLESQEERYWDQFTAMEQALSTLVSQSSYLSSMMGTSSSS